MRSGRPGRRRGRPMPPSRRCPGGGSGTGPSRAGAAPLGVRQPRPGRPGPISQPAFRPRRSTATRGRACRPPRLAECLGPSALRGLRNARWGALPSPATPPMPAPVGDADAHRIAPAPPPLKPRARCPGQDVSVPPHATGRIAAAAPTPSPRASLGAQRCTYASFARARHAPADCAVHPAARPVHGKQYVHCARRCAATFPPPLPAPGAAGHRRTQCVRPTPEFRTPRARAEKAVRACGALYPRPGHARADARLPTPGVRAQPHALRLAPGTGFAPVSTGIVGGFSRTTLVRRPINTRTPWCFGRLPIFLNLYQ